MMEAKTHKNLGDRAAVLFYNSWQIGCANKRREIRYTRVDKLVNRVAWKKRANVHFKLLWEDCLAYSHENYAAS